MAYRFTLPGRTVMGENALQAAAPIIKSFGSKALIVSGKHVTKSGAVGLVTDVLDELNIGWELFNDITGEPTVDMIDAGVGRYREADCDFLVGVGGGSPLDSAKAIAAMSALEGKISDYMGRDIEGSFPPMVLIPTTAGTGSEATRFTIITDTDKNIKMLLRGDALLPNLAVVDSAFTLTAPPDVTAATGMDALTHAVESYTSRRANPMTDMYALDAIRRIFRHLPTAYRNGSDTKAREELMTASYEAGVCINNASVTLVHGMSRPIGALFHVSHGISNAMLITKCLSYALDGCPERFAVIARAIGAAGEDTTDMAAAQCFIKALEGLCGELDIPTLQAYGIDKEEFDALKDKMATDAISSGSPSNTVKELTKEDLIIIYNQLW